MNAATRFDGLRHAITMLLVAGSSLLLLIYIGHGEAQRHYLKFVLDSVVAQGRIVQNSMEGYLRAGLPLRQYPGFTTLARPIHDSDDAISGMFVVDLDKRLVFESGPRSPFHPPATAVSKERSDAVEVRRTNGVYQVVLPLRNKFETVGGLVIEVPRAYVSTRVERSFQSLVFVAIGLSILFVFAVSNRRSAIGNRRIPWLPIAYGLTFITMSAIVVATLIALYSEGVQTKTKALAHSLAQRLSDVISFNLSIEQLDGLERVFHDYRKLNSDISGAALTVNNLVQIHTDSALVGKPWVKASSTYEYKVNLSQPLTNANRVEVVVSVPTAIVYNQVLRTVKNFAALFVASAVLAWLILQLAGIFRLSQNKTSPDQATTAPAQPNNSAVELVKPIFFVAVFLEHLAYPFLPQFVLETIQRSGISDSFVSVPFMAYYLCFALALIPAGRYSERYGPRRPMVCGLLLAAMGLLGLGLANDIGSLMIARALAGIGQGMLFIGVQSYILNTEIPERKTRGAAIIVIGFQGGMISGTAIGSLLVGYIGMDGIFALAGVLAIGMTVYAICLIPETLPQVLHPTRSLSAWRSLARDLVRLLPTSGFLRTMLLIGVPTKAVMTGFVIFALPLILSRMNYAPEDIGQVIMLYAIGVLLASTYSSRLVDRIGRAEMVLFWGAAASGVSLLFVGLIDWQAVSAISGGSTVVLVSGTLLLGAAHGFVLAPVVTRIAESRVADTIGVHSAVTAYRFLERLGHVVGPIIVGQLFIFAGHSAIVATLIGAAVVILALLYLIRPQRELSGTLHGSSSK